MRCFGFESASLSKAIAAKMQSCVASSSDANQTDADHRAHWIRAELRVAIQREFPAWIRAIGSMSARCWTPFKNGAARSLGKKGWRNFEWLLTFRPSTLLSARQMMQFWWQLKFASFRGHCRWNLILYAGKFVWWLFKLWIANVAIDTDGVHVDALQTRSGHAEVYERPTVSSYCC